LFLGFRLRCFSEASSKNKEQKTITKEWKVMNGFIKKSVAGLCLSMTALAGGCCRYREIVDPCWPERYNYMARYEVLDTLNAQAHNGHTLDQTIWNWMFDSDPRTGGPTATLNPAGITQLQYIYRRMPVPDARVFVQTAQDVKYDDVNAEKVMAVRADLDAKRQQAVYNYLAFATGGRAGGPYQVMVIDPGDPGMSALPVGGGQGQRRNLPIGSVLQMQNSFQGSIGVGTSLTGASAGGTSATGNTGMGGTGSMGTGTTGGIAP
jgi:hypothetical protein